MANMCSNKGEVTLTVKDWTSNMWFTSIPKKEINYKPTHVVFDGDVTVVFFDDDTKVIVRRKEDDLEDREHAVSAAIAQKVMGSKNQLVKIVRQAEAQWEKTKVSREKAEAKKEAKRRERELKKAFPLL